VFQEPVSTVNPQGSVIKPRKTRWGGVKTGARSETKGYAGRVSPTTKIVGVFRSLRPRDQLALRKPKARAPRPRQRALRKPKARGPRPRSSEKLSARLSAVEKSGEWIRQLKAPAFDLGLPRGKCWNETRSRKCEVVSATKGKRVDLALKRHRRVVAKLRWAMLNPKHKCELVREVLNVTFLRKKERCTHYGVQVEMGLTLAEGLARVQLGRCLKIVMGGRELELGKDDPAAAWKVESQAHMEKIGKKGKGRLVLECEVNKAGGLVV